MTIRNVLLTLLVAMGCAACAAPAPSTPEEPASSAPASAAPVATAPVSSAPVSSAPNSTTQARTTAAPTPVRVQTVPVQSAPRRSKPAPQMSDPLPPEPMPSEVKSSEGKPSASANNPGVINQSCRTNADCVVKDVGSCCGAMPACVNRSSRPDPAAVQAQCAKAGRVSACISNPITACTCANGRCTAEQEPAGGWTNGMAPPQTDR